MGQYVGKGLEALSQSLMKIVFLQSLFLSFQWWGGWNIKRWLKIFFEGVGMWTMIVSRALVKAWLNWLVLRNLIFYSQGKNFFFQKNKFFFFLHWKKYFNKTFIDRFDRCGMIKDKGLQGVCKGLPSSLRDLNLDFG